MALRDLRVQDMVSISSKWLGSDKVLLEKYTMLSPLVPIIESAHRALLNTQLASTEREMINDALAEKAQAADQLHDRKARALFHLLTGFAEYVDSIEGTARILDTRDALFPDGLKVTRKAFIDQAAGAGGLKSGLSTEVLDQLRALPVPGGGNLEKALDEWIEAGVELGRLQLAKAEMESRKKDGVSLTGADVLRARNQWVRAANGLRSMMNLEDVLDSEVGRLLGPLESALANAERG